MIVTSFFFTFIVIMFQNAWASTKFPSPNQKTYLKEDQEGQKQKEV